MASNLPQFLSSEDVLWISPHQTLPRKCTLGISGPLSLVKVCADFWNLWATTFCGEFGTVAYLYTKCVDQSLLLFFFFLGNEMVMPC